ncbi:hypothetical protein M422DRAFT_256508 [Sphaerobolus stellatus SS14]|uniref:Uncharacterized protein n=1 Tax=Sphaerobolus stellatus (strain SS14) TaxID=990650 RepID=A0A0C9VQM4_SPHS4|nr:hypothetical protein M422DRAFT_256508 [Sphaerobolus stellatus SS14]
MTSEHSGIQQMVRQVIQNASHEEPEKSFLAKASVKMGNPPTYSGKVQLQLLGQCLTDEAQEWFYWQKWFMLTLLLNKVAVNYDHIMQGSMTVQQLHQELTKLAKQMIELPDVEGDVRGNPTYSRNPVKLGNTVNRPTQSNPIRTAVKANNTVVCFNFAGARIEEVILEEDEGQIEEFDEYASHPEEQQEYEDQPEEDDQQYHFDDEEYETRSIDNEVVHVNVNAVIKASGYNDCRRLYGIRVQEAETDLRVSAVFQTGGKERSVYDHQARKKACPLPTRGKENETISVFWDIVVTKVHCLLDSGCEGIMMSSDFMRANKLPKFELEKPVILQLACVGSKSTVQYGLTVKILLGKEKYDEYFNITNVNYYNIILGTLFLRWFEILLDFKNNCVEMGKLSFPNRFGSITPTEADEDEACPQKEKPKALPTPTSK